MNVAILKASITTCQQNQHTKHQIFLKACNNTSRGGGRIFNIKDNRQSPLYPLVTWNLSMQEFYWSISPSYFPAVQEIEKNNLLKQQTGTQDKMNGNKQ